jgi:L-2,4-diaminobutyrate transaminase
MVDGMSLTTETTELDRRYVFHPFTALGAHERDGGPAVIVSGKGSRLTDEQGREYLDGMAGLWCVNVGYSRPEIAEALRDQALRLPYFHGFASMATDVPARLAERVVKIAGLGMSKVFFGNSGSDANDTQVKLVWLYNNLLGRPERKKIISRLRGYHGVTVASASLTGLVGMHKNFDLPLPMIRHVTPPWALWEKEAGESDGAFVARLAQELEDAILAEGPETVAAFIAEPIQGAGGVIVPPDGYFAAIQAVLRKYDILFIVDEVITGFGRMGEWMGSHKFGLEPDLITVAKGITSGYVPLSGCIVSEKVWRVLADQADGPFQHGFTYSSHPLAAAAAMTNLDIVENEGLVARAGEAGDYLRARMREAFADHPLVAEVRGAGLIGAVELVAERDPATRFDPALGVAPRVVTAALSRGVIVRALAASDIISFSPPFVVTNDEIDTIVSVVRESVDEVADSLVRDRVG